MSENAENRRRRLAIATFGLVLGVVVAFVLPSSWVFVPDAHGPHGDAGGSGEQYACPMFCVVVDVMPDDRRCPVCGMELGAISSESRLDRAEQRMIGLEVDVVRRIPLARTIRVLGEVDYDETRLSRITTRMAGWLEKVWVDTTWAEVKQGDPLASIYSPELYAAQQELLVAEGGLSAAAERRLELLGIGKEEIAELRATGKVRESLVLRAPRDGLVVTRNALEGTSVATGATLYTVADLSRVWVQTEVFEMDLPWIRQGQEARLEVDGAAGPLRGRIAFVDPVIDRSTRTVRVRIQVENAPADDGRRPLRIGQRVDAWIEARLGEDGRLAPPGGAPPRDPLAVPRSAVLKTGERSVVYALFTSGEGGPVRNLDPKRLPDDVLYEMVEVRIGPPARRVGGSSGEKLFPLLDAGPLGEGAAIVTKGNLLLDSQAQLSGKPSLLFPQGSRGGGSSDPHAGH